MQKLNRQGFTIIALNPRSETFMKPIDAAFMFELNGFRVSVSTGGSVESGGCLQEIYIHNPVTNKEYYVPHSVEKVINDIIRGEYDFTEDDE